MYVARRFDGIRKVGSCSGIDHRMTLLNHQFGKVELERHWEHMQHRRIERLMHAVLRPYRYMDPRSKCRELYHAPLSIISQAFSVVSDGVTRDLTDDDIKHIWSYVATTSLRGLSAVDESTNTGYK